MHLFTITGQLKSTTIASRVFGFFDIHLLSAFFALKSRAIMGIFASTGDVASAVAVYRRSRILDCLNSLYRAKITVFLNLSPRYKVIFRNK